eukprot:TRINITY_DN14538_c0_g1_i1.p4 TRINITY_DN14538_c0_g1~~TRINITY_DN14538_c0_g1_i1.p4  ORF type:complete len:133 (-),score=30.38 TRINITY_DN14538_c0_g1_i1:172-570(-)
MRGFGTEGIDGNMWTQKQLAEEIQKLAGGQELFYSQIQRQMKQIVYLTLKACMDLVIERKNSVELYGYDFMIDQDFNPWIIEINSSPSMDYSTRVTEVLVKEALTDAIKVLIDYGQCKKKKEARIDLSLIHI